MWFDTLVSSPGESHFCLCFRAVSLLLSQNTIDWVVYKQQKLTSHGSGGWKSNIKALEGVVPCEGLLSGSQMAPTGCVFMEVDKSDHWGSFVKSQIPSMRVPLSSFNQLPKPHI